MNATADEEIIMEGKAIKEAEAKLTMHISDACNEAHSSCMGGKIAPIEVMLRKGDVVMVLTADEAEALSQKLIVRGIGEMGMRR